MTVMEVPFVLSLLLGPLHALKIHALSVLSKISLASVID